MLWQRDADERAPAAALRRLATASMSRPRFRLIPAVHLLLEKEGQVLLLRRFQIGYEDGNYSVVAGHANGNETLTQAMAREALEEAGIVVDPDDLVLVHVMHRRTEDERVDFFFSASRWAGDPRNAEPHKCSDVRWFPRDQLPPNVVPYVRIAIEHVRSGVVYSELGWDGPR